MSEPARIKMKELEERTGVGREAVRFYIREGILPEPERPRRNVAWYSESHVQRLQLIRYLQAEREFSLSRIKAVLADDRVGPLVGQSSMQGMEQLLPALMDDVDTGSRLSVADFCAESGWKATDVEEYAELGIIRIVDEHGEAQLDARDASLLRTWVRTQRAGFDEGRGYDARYLKHYLDAVTALARFEVAHFVSAFDSFEPESGARQAVLGISAANDLIRQIHTRSLLAELDVQIAGVPDPHDPQGS